jgi:uncharacterized protein (DUF1330 family)
MPAYIVARMAIRDPEAFDRYKSRSVAAVRRFGGRFLSRGGAMECLEGNADPRRLVILEFDDAEQARAFYWSEDYQSARQYRIGATDSMDIILTQGFEPGHPQE